jgi:hypothetical protein
MEVRIGTMVVHTPSQSAIALRISNVNASIVGSLMTAGH